MHVSVETTSTSNNTLECRMTVGVPRERIEPQVQDRLRSLARTAKFNGFRPGKVPMRLVEQRYGSKVREEVLGEVLRGSFDEAIQRESLHPISQPSFNIDSDPKNLEQGLFYTVVFEIPSGITTIQVEGLEVEKPVAEITEADVDIMLYRLREQRQIWHPVSTPAKEGDRVTIDFVDMLNDNSLEKDKVKDLSLILGKTNVLLPGLEEKLREVCSGEEHEIPLTFPANYSNPNLAGKTVRFKIQIKAVESAQLPELDEEFVKALGVESGNLEILRQDVRNNMERELNYAIQSQTKQQILIALLRANPVHVPQTLVDEEAQRLLQKFKQDLQAQGRNVEELNLTPILFKEQARRRVKLNSLVVELAKTNSIQIDPNQVRQFVEKVASTYEDAEAVIEWYYADTERLQEVESTLLEDQVVDWLLGRAKITEKKTDFYTLMVQSREKIIS